MRSRTYREQVAAFRQLFSEFPKDVEGVRDGLVRGHLIKLNGLLSMHFKMEEQYIFPDLLKQTDPAMRGLVRELREELTPLVDEFDEFYTIWSRPGACTTDPVTFLDEWRNVRLVLDARLEREERELFTAFDRAKIA
jgi:hypothetical protein